MKIALAAVGFVNNDIRYNLDKIRRTLEAYQNKADMVVFGEAFLQGFDSLKWDFEKDVKTAFSIEDEVITEIRKTAKKYSIAVSFGYIERDGDKLYSSQMTLGKTGDVIDNYRRVSIGWKEEKADSHYCEGESFSSFLFDEKTFSIGLCGDLWYDENIKKIRELRADIILWPVYTDYNFKEWNSSAKYEYAGQTGKIGGNVLYVNSYSMGVEKKEMAMGGAVFFSEGEIKKEIPSGKEGILVVEV